ncbi:MAG: hypothetical protein KC591_15265, partial [Gemmatimonadetes bacterium]|nr:hypothetical protein [Gemmatimonadota bacterium]
VLWAGLIALAFPVPARAFNSYPIGAYHDRITKEAAAPAGFSRPALRALQKAVRAPDWDETRKWYPLRPNGNYRPEHHFDRPRDLSSSEAFVRGAAYAREQLAIAIDLARADDPAGAIAALGRALHAAQDLSSHSNLVRLPPPERQACEAAFWSGAPPPATLTLTGYDATAEDPERPPGDDYPHARYAKDSPRKNDESSTELDGDRTAFELAYAEAVARSRAVLDRFLGAIPEAARHELGIR